jgi:hypothetical protein
MVKFIMQMHGNFRDSMVGWRNFFHCLIQSLHYFACLGSNHCCSMQVVPERLVDHFGGKISGTIKLEEPTGQIFDVELPRRRTE